MTGPVARIGCWRGRGLGLECLENVGPRYRLKHPQQFSQFELQREHTTTGTARFDEREMRQQRAMHMAEIGVTGEREIVGGGMDGNRSAALRNGATGAGSPHGKWNLGAHCCKSSGATRWVVSR